MPKIAFINPIGFGTMSEQGAHIGLAYIAASCQQAGHDVRVIALNNVKNPDENVVISDLACWGADIIGFTVNSFSVAHAIQMASKIRLAMPKTKIIAGGIHPTVSLKRFLNENHLLFDVIVLGEGDFTILEVIDCMDMNKPLSIVHGIAFIKDNDVFITPPRKRIKEIDKLPFPAYSLFEPNLPLNEYYPMITSRGCPYDCIFCISKTFWNRRFCARSSENVLEEIRWAKEKYGFQELRIFDDNFTQDKERAIKICKGIVDIGFNIKLTLVNGIRADSVDEELAIWLKQAGLHYLMIGVEDGNKETFQKINKGETLDDISNAIKIFRNIGIKVEATMVIGLPGTTYKTTINSLKFLQEHSINGHWIIAVPFKGTQLYNYATEEGQLLLDVEAGFNMSMVNYPPLIAFDTPEFKREERLKAFEMVNIASENYHFLVRPEETLQDAGERILKIIEKLEPEKREYHCKRINEIFGGVINAIA
ncbi:MAG: radical SAM protein [Phycisphaerae bacterium]|jgi:radical SAM superfamily enzyme YgiQ (UPF0313 family)